MPVSLTCCWSWDEMLWDCMAEINVSVTHKLLVMGWDVMGLHGRNKCQCHSQTVGHGMRCDETAWQKWMSVSLTSCWSWDEMWWDCMAEINVSVTHILLVMGWDVMRLPCGPQWQHSLTGCWLYHEIWLTCIVEKGALNTTHFLLVVGWYVAMLLVMQYYSLTLNDKIWTH